MSTNTEWISLILTKNVFTFIVFLVFLAIALHIFNDIRSKNLPPGPINLPIVGHMPFMIGKRMENVFEELKEKYGGIVSFKLGATQVVLLNSYETIKDALILNPEVAITRPEDFSAFNYMFSNLGHLVENGKVWAEQRRFLMRTLRDLGMGKQRLETEIREESTVQVEEIRKYVNRPYDVHQLFINATANIMSSLLNGYRFKYSDPAFRELLYMNFTIPNRISPFKLVNNFPYIRFMLPPFLSGMAEVIEARDLLNEFWERMIQEHKVSEEEVYDYTNLYLKQQQQDRQNRIPDSTYTTKRLRSNAMILNAAGIVTTSDTMYWAMKMIIRNPSMQKRIHEEIDDVIGSERIPSYSDKINMPYTEAFLMEVQRTGDVVPLGVPHSTRVATKIAGYDIPKGATIMPLLYMVHNDPKIWGDPENFRPERFIGKDGKVKKTEYLIPFSTGKRSCPGETLAVMEVFIFFTGILQNFTIRPATIADADIKVGKLGFTRAPVPFQVIFQERHDTHV